MANTKVLITAIISGAFVLCMLVAGLVFLSYNKADASTVLSLVSTIVAALNSAALFYMRGSLNALKEQTNGTTDKLVTAVINSPAAPVESQ